MKAWAPIATAPPSGANFTALRISVVRMRSIALWSASIDTSALTSTSTTTRFSRAVGAQAFNDHIYFFVEDDGPGIARKDLARLGRPFEQADTTMANGMKGSGLGLAIANSLVELHGGSLRINSRVGEGTGVLVALPKIAPSRRAMALAAVA